MPCLAPPTSASKATRVDCVVLDLVMPDLDGSSAFSARMRQAGLDTPSSSCQTAHGRHRQCVLGHAAPAPATSWYSSRPPAGASWKATICAMRFPPRRSPQLTCSASARSRDGTPDPVRRHHPLAGDAAGAHRRREVGRLNIPVLLEGESGVGKEMMARLFYPVPANACPQAKPLSRVNCWCDAEKPRSEQFDTCSVDEKGSVHRRHRKAHRQIRRSRRRHLLFLDGSR